MARVDFSFSLVSKFAELVVKSSRRVSSEEDPLELKRGYFSVPNGGFDGGFIGALTRSPSRFRLICVDNRATEASCGRSAQRFSLFLFFGSFFSWQEKNNKEND